MTGVPAAEVRARLSRLRAALARSRIGGYFTTDRRDVHYLSGFTGDDSALLITAGKLFLITDSRYLEEGAATAPAFEVLCWRQGLPEFAGKLARKCRLGSLGFSPEQLTVTVHQALKRGAYGVKLKPVKELVANLRACKSPWEVRRIREALTCAEDAFTAVQTRIKHGMREIDLRLDLEWEMRRRGASDAAFEIIVGAGANASKPHAHAGTRKLTAGGPVLIDFGARVKFYNSDLTRVIFLGEPAPKWRRRYELVLEAQRQGIAAIRPGVSGSEVDAAARAVFEQAGCARNFTHGLGHGVGLAVHEQPGMGARSKTILCEGMVVTAEPGLYYPRSGGIRIEDMLLVTATGAQCLSHLEK